MNPTTYTGADPISKEEVHRDNLRRFYLRLRKAAGNCKCGASRTIYYDGKALKWTVACLACGTSKTLCEPKMRTR